MIKFQYRQVEWEEVNELGALGYRIDRVLTATGTIKGAAARFLYLMVREVAAGEHVSCASHGSDHEQYARGCLDCPTCQAA